VLERWLIAAPRETGRSGRLFPLGKAPMPGPRHTWTGSYSCDKGYSIVLDTKLERRIASVKKVLTSLFIYIYIVVGFFSYV
jgi:hypothetical protein